MHIFVEGRSGMGLSELVTHLAERALAETRFREPFGYRTWYLVEPESGRKLIYISPWGRKGAPAQEWLVGTCLNGHPETKPEVFDRFAPQLEQIPPGSFSVFDELGVMEGRAPQFVAAAEKVLDQPGVVLAAIRDIDAPFLNRLRAREDVRIFSYTKKELREALEEEAFLVLKEQLEKL